MIGAGAASLQWGTRVGWVRAKPVTQQNPRLPVLGYALTRYPTYNSPLLRKTDEQACTQRIETRIEEQSQNRDGDQRHEHVDRVEGARRIDQQMAEAVGR